MIKAQICKEKICVFRSSYKKDDYKGVKNKKDTVGQMEGSVTKLKNNNKNKKDSKNASYIRNQDTRECSFQRVRINRLCIAEVRSQRGYIENNKIFIRFIERKFIVDDEFDACNKNG